MTPARSSLRSGDWLASACGAWLAVLPAVALAGAAPVAAPDIRDIRPPYPASPDWLWIAGLAALALCAALGLWWWRSRVARRPQPSLHDAVLGSLHASRALIAAGDARGFSIAVSDTLRGYIERRFEVRAPSRTTDEFLRDCLAGRAVPLRSHERLLGEFLGHCDLAKFARWPLSTAEMEALLDSAISFVTAARPDPVAGRSAPAAAPAPSGSAA